MSQDISCVTYNLHYNNAINEIAQTSNTLRTWTRVNNFTNNPFIVVHPSCGGISTTLEERMVNKKKYMFSNNRNNVESGSKGSVLTKSQIFARVARGNTPKGDPSKKYALQNNKITNPNFYNLPRRGNAIVFNTCCNLENIEGSGAITYVNGYTTHTFINSTTFILGSTNVGCSFNCDILLVGGGGPGGWVLSEVGNWAAGGGGGGGEVITQQLLLTSGSYNINIGAASTGQKYLDGNSSYISKNANVLLIANGGKKGIDATSGLVTSNYETGGASGNGNNGGITGGGGGGAGGDGGYGTNNNTPPGGNGGKGGNGILNDYTGTSIKFGAGGGGGGINGGGDGGDNSGGNGGSNNSNGYNATTWGGGGGGASVTNALQEYTGGNGASGLIIIRYKKNN